MYYYSALQSAPCDIALAELPAPQFPYDVIPGLILLLARAISIITSVLFTYLGGGEGAPSVVCRGDL